VWADYTCCSRCLLLTLPLWVWAFQGIWFCVKLCQHVPTLRHMPCHIQDTAWVTHNSNDAPVITQQTTKPTSDQLACSSVHCHGHALPACSHAQRARAPPLHMHSVSAQLLSPELPGGHLCVELSDQDASEAQHRNTAIVVLSPVRKFGRAAAGALALGRCGVTGGGARCSWGCCRLARCGCRGHARGSKSLAHTHACP
jgi:hypothetical protein